MVVPDKLCTLKTCEAKNDFDAEKCWNCRTAFELPPGGPPRCPEFSEADRFDVRLNLNFSVPCAYEDD